MQLVKRLFHKRLLILIFSVQLSGCSTSKIENRIVNDLLHEELRGPQYKSYLEHEIILIKEAGKKNAPLLTYEKLYKKKNFTHNDTKWALDTRDIKNLKKKINGDEVLFWKTADFKNVSITIIDAETNLINHKNEIYLTSTEKLILNLSKPLKIDESEYLVYFYAKSSIWGGIDRQFVALMKKKVNYWVIDTCYPVEEFFP